MNRRDFIKRAGTFSAGAVTGATAALGSAAAWTEDTTQPLFDGIEQQYQKLSDQFGGFSKKISGKVDGLALRVDLLTAEAAMQRVLLNLLFLLMLISFGIDGGTAFLILTA